MVSRTGTESGSGVWMGGARRRDRDCHAKAAQAGTGSPVLAPAQHPRGSFWVLQNCLVTTKYCQSPNDRHQEPPNSH